MALATLSIIMYSLIISIVQFNQTVNECLAILAESGSETTSKNSKFSWVGCPQTPLVGACFARTLYTDTSIFATNGLSTSYLLPTPLVLILPNVCEDYSSKHSVTYKAILYVCQPALHNLYSIRKIVVARDTDWRLPCTHSVVRHSMQAPPWWKVTITVVRFRKLCYTAGSQL